MLQEFQHTFVMFIFNTVLYEIQKSNTKNMNTHKVSKKFAFHAGRKDAIENYLIFTTNTSSAAIR
jgi:hypothetical protein